LPHLTIEYSANLEHVIQVQSLVDRLHRAAVETEVFPIGGIRTRAVVREHFRVADGHPENAFVHVVLRMARGRDVETRQRVGQHLFNTLCEALAPTTGSRPLAISFEVEEIDPAWNYRRNNLHDIVGARRKGVRPPATPGSTGS
jgi:5-carboxymethyl-2-hydroxymuconate isomerase